MQHTGTKQHEKTEKMDDKSFGKLTFEEKGRVVRSFNSPEENVKTYDAWSTDHAYDKDAKSYDYTGPSFLAITLQKYLPDKMDASILDVGAGTGLAGEKLRDLGYTNVDGLEPSKGMFEVARNKNFYRNYLCAFFTSNVDEIETNAYDALVSSGCLVEGHLKCDSFPEMIRCVKPGGIIVLLGRENDILTAPEFKDRFEPYIKELEEQGQWTVLERTVFPGYLTNVNGITFVFKVTK